MKKVFLIVIISILFTGCEMDDSGGAVLETEIADEIIKATASSGIDVEEFNISSADIFAFSYDFGSSKWKTSASSTGNTQDNDNKALLLVDDLRFSKNKVQINDLDDNNIPGTIDVLYFDNVGHSIKVGGIWYGDLNCNISNINVCTNIYVDSANNELTFHFFDVVFINRNILNRKILFDSMNNTYTAEDGNSVSDMEKAVITRVSEQVRRVEEKAIFLPFDPINNIKDGTIKVSVKMADMVDRIEGSKIYWKNTNGMPLDYDIASE